jgi:hypothetical protein
VSLEPFEDLACLGEEGYVAGQLGVLELCDGKPERDLELPEPGGGGHAKMLRPLGAWRFADRPSTGADQVLMLVADLLGKEVKRFPSLGRGELGWWCC